MSSEPTENKPVEMAAIKISDVAGLSQPLTKLINVFARAVGCIYRPIAICDEADAKAYAIRRIGKAMADVSPKVGQAAFNEGGITISVSQTPSIAPEAAPTIDGRAQHRIAYQAAKQQANIESITALAAEQLKGEKTVSDAPVEDDWITRFYIEAGAVSNEQMKSLWAKVLAGEVKSPGSFSLRTLEVLKHLSTSEAKAFESVVQFSISYGDTMVLPDSDDLRRKMTLRLEEVVSLQNTGLVHPSVLTLTMRSTNPEQLIVLQNGNFLILMTSRDNVKGVLIPCYPFSTAGRELSRLVPVKLRTDFITEFCNEVRSETLNWKYAEVVSREGTSFRYKDLKDVPGILGYP